MERKNFMVTQRHTEQLTKEAKEMQVSVSEILRKAIDAYFKKGADNGK